MATSGLSKGKQELARSWPYRRLERVQEDKVHRLRQKTPRSDHHEQKQDVMLSNSLDNP